MSRRNRSPALFWEQVYPYAIGSCAAAAWWYLGISMPKGSLPDLLSAALTLGAILTGFLATSKTILFGMKSSLLMRQLRKAGYATTLMSYLGQGIWISFLFSILCLAGFFVPESFCETFGVVWIFLGVTAAAAFYRVTKIILLLLKREDEDSDAPATEKANESSGDGS